MRACGWRRSERVLHRGQRALEANNHQAALHDHNDDHARATTTAAAYFLPTPAPALYILSSIIQARDNYAYPLIDHGDTRAGLLGGRRFTTFFLVQRTRLAAIYKQKESETARSGSSEQEAKKAEGGAAYTRGRREECAAHANRARRGARGRGWSAIAVRYRFAEESDRQESSVIGGQRVML